MKHTLKVYLDTETESKLKRQAEEVGINGRAWLTHYIELIAKENICFLDNNLKKVLKALKV